MTKSKATPMTAAERQAKRKKKLLGDANDLYLLKNLIKYNLEKLENCEINQKEFIENIKNSLN